MALPAFERWAGGPAVQQIMQKSLEQICILLLAPPPSSQSSDNEEPYDQAKDPDYELGQAQGPSTGDIKVVTHLCAVSKYVGNTAEGNRVESAGV